MPYPQKAPFAVDANGVPSDADCNSIDWATSYLDYAVGNAFGRLYNNYDNLGDAWAAYWKVVASKYMNFPGVMGYDLMNGMCFEDEDGLFFFLCSFCSVVCVCTLRMHVKKGGRVLGPPLIQPPA